MLGGRTRRRRQSSVVVVAAHVDDGGDGEDQHVVLAVGDVDAVGAGPACR
jgi:hypothetical protein